MLGNDRVGGRGLVCWGGCAQQAAALWLLLKSGRHCLPDNSSIGPLSSPVILTSYFDNSLVRISFPPFYFF